MASAELEQTTADIEVKGRDGKPYGLRASGSVVMFDGFLKLYEEGRDDRVRLVDKGKEDQRRTTTAAACRRSPRATASTTASIEAEQHFTEPPPRYSEATLVKSMEELGIGRPSTYASTLAVLQERDYVRIDKKRLIPEDKGRLVTAFLESFFKRYVEYDFTADLEEKLDLISDGKLEWKDVLRDFWRDFMRRGRRDQGPARRRGAGSAERAAGSAHLPAAGRGRRPAPVPELRRGPPEPQGQRQVRRLHRLLELSRLPLHAPAHAAGATARPRPRRPTASCSATIPRRASPSRCASAASAPTCSSAKPARTRTRSPSARRFPRASMPTASTSSTRCSCCRCRARSASIPRPASRSRPASAATGRSSCTTAPMPTCRRVEEVFTVGINRAVVLLAEKKAGGGKGRFQRAAPTVLKELGEHPERRRQDAGAVGPLRPLRQARRRQRHAAARQGAGGADHGRGRAADRRARGQGPVQGQGPPRQATANSQGRTTPKRRQGARPSGQSSKAKGKAKGKGKAAGTREAAE